jgi:hypothetical protein
MRLRLSDAGFAVATVGLSGTWEDRGEETATVSNFGPKAVESEKIEE